MYVLQRGEKNGKPVWSLRFETRDPGTGKRKYVYETFHGPRREAERRWIKRQGEIETQGSGFVKPDRQPLAAYMDGWLRDYGEQHLKPTTLDSYRILVRVHIAPGLGAVPLADLTAAQVSTWQAALARKKTKGTKKEPDGRPLSPRRVAYARAVLRAALQEAVRLGLIPTNPVDRVRAPRQDPKEIKAFTLDEVRRLVEVAREHRLAALLAAAWQTGMRLGELLALTWGDVDFEAGTIRVHRNLAHLRGGRRIIQTPKTERGTRTIALTRTLAAELKTHRARQAEDRLKAGAAWEDGGLVFCTRQGKGLSPRNVERLFCLLRDRAGLPSYGFHSLRHTKATLAKLAGVDIAEIAADLGHTSPAFTAKTYAHVLPESQRAAAERFEALVRGGIGGHP